MKLKVGDIRYLSGFSTKIKILRNPDHKFVYCEIIEVSPHSNHKTGDKTHIMRKILWKYRGR